MTGRYRVIRRPATVVVDEVTVIRRAIYGEDTMKRRGPDSIRKRTPGASVAVAGVVGAAASALFAAETGNQLAVAATLLLVGDVRRRSGLTSLVGWLLGGSLLGAALGYAATGFAGVPLATDAGIGLGIALGGGVGAVSNLLAEDARDDGDGAETAESMTVDMEADDSASPQPADLFDGHPDPVLYVADQGHGPVVLAANDAFTETFDVPGDAMSGTPLDEALMVTDDAADSNAVTHIVDAIEAGERADTDLTCQTPGEPTRFRLRTAGRGADGYVVYTPLDRKA